MKSVRILATHYDPDRRRFEVVKECTDDDGVVSLNLHTFPESALEWKAAEYGLTAVEEALDVILYEPFEAPADRSVMGTSQGRQQYLSKVIQRKQALGNGKQANRVSARAKLVDAKVHDKYVTASEEDPYEVVKAHAPFDRSAILVKNIAVLQAHGSDAKQRRDEVRTQPARQAATRKQLFRQSNMRREGQK
jgi:hypothetical protein